MQKVSIIIPVFNEIRTIGEILKKVDAVRFENMEKEIVIVDDCSADGTTEFLKGFNGQGYKIIFNDKNLGKGSSVKNGLSKASGDFFAIQDADLEYEPSDYANLLRILVEKKASIVFGSRFPGLNNWTPISPLQKLAHRVIGFSSAFLSGVKINDPTSCYKIFDKKFKDYALPVLRSKSFTIEAELAALAGKSGLKYLEMPIHYHPRDYSEGKKIKWFDGIKILAAILRYNII